jgi:hypothetical protein
MIAWAQHTHRPVPARLHVRGVAASRQKIPRVDLGWGIDTVAAAWSEGSWHDAVPEIYSAWREYLLNDPHLQQASPHWSADEQRRWPFHDLTAGIAYKGMPATVIDIRPAERGSREFVVKTPFASASSDGGAIRPVAVTRVYATRDDDRWVFATALPRLTREWRREQVGPITYIVDPALTFSRDRAAAAVSFADSLAVKLGVPPLSEVTYLPRMVPSGCTRSWV